MRYHPMTGSFSAREDFYADELDSQRQLTLPEFVRLLGERDPQMSAEDCQSAFDEIDTDSDGRIDFARFLTWWNEQLLQ